MADFEHTRPLPYLGDLARLEWAAHQAYGAADAAPWDVSALAAIDPDDHARLCLQWAPGLAVVASPWPIVRLWTLHQPGHGGEFTVDWDVAERALVAREGWAVTVSALGAGDAAFLDHMLAGAALGAAADAALQVQPSFDLGALLGRLVAAGQVCGFTLATPT